MCWQRDPIPHASAHLRGWGDQCGNWRSWTHTTQRQLKLGLWSSEMDGALQNVFIYFIFFVYMYSKTDSSPMCARYTVGGGNTPKEWTAIWTKRRRRRRSHPPRHQTTARCSPASICMQGASREISAFPMQFALHRADAITTHWLLCCYFREKTFAFSVSKVRITILKLKM